MPHPIPARALALALLILPSACATGQSAPAPEVDLAGLQMGSARMRALNDVSIVLVGKLEQTGYGTPALYPAGRQEGLQDADRCIDVVHPTSRRDSIRQRVGQQVRLSGRFVFVDTLPTYTTSLNIEGRSHVPVCQVFATISPYPYFLVDRID